MLTIGATLTIGTTLAVVSEAGLSSGSFFVVAYAVTPASAANAAASHGRDELSEDELEEDELEEDDTEIGAALTLLCEILWLTGAAVGFAGAGAAAITIAVGADATGAAATMGAEGANQFWTKGGKYFTIGLGCTISPFTLPQTLFTSQAFTITEYPP